MGQLARVLTVENEREVLPRFLGLSAREAAEVAAEHLPRADPPRRELVTSLPPVRPEPTRLALAPGPPPATGINALVAATAEVPPPAPATPAPLHTYEVPAPRLERLRTPEVEPLTADLRRLHLTVPRALLDKVAMAKDGLSHAMPGATTEQVLEAALDLLLERQARRKAFVKPAASRTPTRPGSSWAFP